MVMTEPPLFTVKVRAAIKVMVGESVTGAERGGRTSSCVGNVVFVQYISHGCSRGLNGLLSRDVTRVMLTVFNAALWRAGG